ncbi:MAG: glyoxalase/bleomycin resistance/extradiol dioxygenase family protein [Bradyrhizobiaceae bacterium]|nr:glyoxalase/bleomycin resistance/extradiol dioxygenase family protein [Bradyrhizobiaceae bacterium]
MPSAIYVNLPVADLKQSKAFFESLGFTFNPQFTNDDAAALVFSDTIFAMLHTPQSFRRFTKKEICDARKTTEVLLALQVESREQVNALMEKALKAGGRAPREAQDLDFMFERSFEDPDGHIWEVFWMDPKAMPQA